VSHNRLEGSSVTKQKQLTLLQAAEHQFLLVLGLFALLMKSR